MSRAVPFDTLLAAMLPFFVTRQIFAGAGKCGIEAGTSGVAAKGNVFQLSQRADFFTTTASVDTLYNRPIVNTRDEPHADPKRFRRFHVICGDANMMETATFLKVGTTLLVLRLLERGFTPSGVALRDPVAAIKQISRDTSWKWAVERDGGGTMSAVAIQRVYLDLAQSQLRGFSEETDAVMTEWERVLDALESDPLSLSDTLDWAAKYSLLSEYRESEKLAWDAEAMFSLDWEYHNVDPEAGLYYALEQEGRVRRIVTEEQIAAAAQTAPEDSPRPVVRGMAVRKFTPAMRDLSWSRFTLDDGSQSTTVHLGLADDLNALQLAESLEETHTPGAFVAALSAASNAANRDNITETDAVLIGEA